MGEVSPPTIYVGAEMSIETLIRDTAKEIMELRHAAMQGLVEARDLNLNGAKKAGKIINRGARLTLALSCPHNEVKGVKGFKETGRSRYVTDEEFERVKICAHYTVVDAMDIALLTGQRPADVLKIRRADIRDGALWIVQNKTGARLGIEVTGELAAVIDRIKQRPSKAISAYLIQDENGQPLSQFALRSRFDKARTLAKVDFQFRDIRAKAATDTGDLAHSQKLLAHKNREMTEHYVRSRLGERVSPLR